MHISRFLQHSLELPIAGPSAIGGKIWSYICMKTVTLHVSEPVYREFQEAARRQNCSTAALIHEAMEAYRQRLSRKNHQSLRNLRPLDLGETKLPLTAEDDLLAEMLP